MNCATARELLLVADPADLEGRTESELSRHLRDCEVCRQAAELVLHALAELEFGLGSDSETSALTTARFHILHNAPVTVVPVFRRKCGRKFVRAAGPPPRVRSRARRAPTIHPSAGPDRCAGGGRARTRQPGP